MQPTDGPITQEYNTYPQASGEPWGHTGRDYGGAFRAVCRTISDGTVIFAGWGQHMSKAMCDTYAFVFPATNSGICVLVQHEGWVEGFFHLDETKLNAGQRVVRGQEVGRLGATGRVFGAHLHYEVISHTHKYNAPFGRFAPGNQIAHEDRVAASKLAAVRAAAAKAALSLQAAAHKVIGSKTVKVTGNPAWVRIRPDHNAPAAPGFGAGLAKGANLVVVGYVAGSDPFKNGNNAWLKTKSGYFVWANNAGNSLAGLRRL